MVYARLRELRIYNDWTQEEVARRLFVNRRTYSAYEHGNSRMSPEILIALARVYDTSVDYILGLTDQKKPFQRRFIPS